MSLWLRLCRARFFAVKLLFSSVLVAAPPRWVICYTWRFIDSAASIPIVKIPRHYNLFLVYVASANLGTSFAEELLRIVLSPKPQVTRNASKLLLA
jgi:hypothetical protein